MLPPAKAYQWALDKAVMQVQSGAINYNQAIKTAVKELADSGLKVVDCTRAAIEIISMWRRGGR